MCGRFTLFVDPKDLMEAFPGFEVPADWTPRYNIAPTQPVAVIANNNQDKIEFFQWGLIPSWAKDPKIGNRMINARAETVAEKPSFRTAFRKRRCLIPADGFYEWHTDAGQKTPWFISLASNEPFAFAGLWESWSDKETGETLETATIITTAANDFMSRLHHRMPVVTAADKADDWLQGAEGALEKLIGNSPRFRAWPVDRRVNNARNEGRELIDAAGDTISA